MDLNMNNNNDNNDNDNRGRPFFLSMAMVPPRRQAFAAERSTSATNTKMAPFHAEVHQSVSSSPTTTNATTTTPTTWPSLDKLTRLSYYHPLEETHAKFRRSALPAVLQRLMRAFYELSIVVEEYDNDRLVAQCNAMHGNVCFQVGFFASRHEQEDVVIFELQRTAGDSMTFYQQYAHVLLQMVQETAAAGETVQQKPQQQPDNVQDSNGNNNQRQQQQQPRRRCPLDALAAPCTPADLQHALDVASGLVTTASRLDTRRLGLESLKSLTCMTSCGQTTAMYMAQAICGKDATLSNTLWKVVVKKDDNDHDDDHYDDIPCTRLGLQVWTNVWTTMLMLMDRDTNHHQYSSFDHADDVVSVLMSHVQQQPKCCCPHKATLALQALHAWTKLQQQQQHQQPAQSNNAMMQNCQHHSACLHAAHAVGCAQHAALQHASHQVLETLNLNYHHPTSGGVAVSSTDAAVMSM